LAILGVSLIDQRREVMHRNSIPGVAEAFQRMMLRHLTVNEHSTSAGQAPTSGD
jgi:hypothetical protein